MVISPKNFFLFTPLLPSVAVGTLNPRSIIQPTRYITRHKSRAVSVIEAEATDVDVSMLLYFPPTLRHVTLPTAYQQNHHFHRLKLFYHTSTRDRADAACR